MTLRKGHWFLLCALAVAGAAAIVLLRSEPVRETRRFLKGPIPVDRERFEPADLPESDRREVEARYGKAMALFGSGNYESAASGLRQILETYPNAPEAPRAQWNLTRSLLRSGDANGAVESFYILTGRYASLLEEEAPPIYSGLRHLEGGRTEEARAEFDRMIGEYPESEFTPLAHALLGRIHWSHGEAKEMVRSFSRMLASVHDPVPAYRDLARAIDTYAGKPYEESLPALEALASLHEGDGFGDIHYYIVARSHLENYRYEEARNAFEEFRERYRGGDFSHIVDLEHAWNALHNGRPGEALPIFLRYASSEAPEPARAFDAFFAIRAESRMAVARCHLALEDYDRAITEFRNALEEDPEGIYALENRIGLAHAFEKKGDLRKAALELERALRDHPSEPRLFAVRRQLARLEKESTLR